MTRPSYGRWTDGTNTPTEILASNEGMEKVGISISTAVAALIPKGTVMGRISASGLYVPYDDDGTDDGRRVAVGILVDDVDPTVSADASDLRLNGSMYVRGTFYTDKLAGMDANGLADLGGREVAGANLTII